MKSEFKSRPVYLSRKDRIEAHFMTCFLALTLYRVLEHKLEHQFTCPQLLKTLREFNFNHHYGIGYVPTFSRNYTSLKYTKKREKNIFYSRKVIFFNVTSGGIKELLIFMISTKLILILTCLISLPHFQL